MRIALLPAIAVALTACTPQTVYRDRIVTVEVPVPVQSPCVPAALGAAPAYPDSRETLAAAPDAAERYRLMGQGWPLRDARLGELETVVAGCPKAPK